LSCVKKVINRRDISRAAAHNNCAVPAILSSRIGKAKAVTATARKVAVLFYNAVRHGMEYVDAGASSYETRYRTRVVNNLHRRAKAFGFVLQPLEPKARAVVS
jgi:transposase